MSGHINRAGRRAFWSLGIGGFIGAALAMSSADIPWWAGVAIAVGIGGGIYNAWLKDAALHRMADGDQ